MDKRKFNSGTKGNSGGGRVTKKEDQQHLAMWKNDSKVRELEAKIATGVYSISDVYYLHALKANVPILKNLADKVLANLVDVRGADGEPLNQLPQEDRDLIASALKYAGTRKPHKEGGERSGISD